MVVRGNKKVVAQGDRKAAVRGGMKFWHPGGVKMKSSRFRVRKEMCGIYIYTALTGVGQC
jgi:hypothetical protein